MTSGVYLLTNLRNGKRYVGSSCRVETRVRHHLSGHGSLLVGRAVKKYGRDAFTVSILDVCEREKLPAVEARWIAELAPEYNLDSLTDSGGRVVSEASRKKMSDAKKGKPGFFSGHRHSDETKALLSAASKGRRWTERQRAINGKSFLGRTHTPEARAKIAAGQRGQGRPMPTEAKEAIARRVRDLWQDPEYRERQMAARRNKLAG